MRRPLFLFGLSVFAGILAAVPALASGYWNVPSNFCQCMGYGCGAGYHAKFILGPVSCEGFLATNNVRVPYSPRPACTYGYGNCGESFHEPSAIHPAALPPSRLQYAPTPALHHAPLRR